jgi:hypothetical protein
MDKKAELKLKRFADKNRKLIFYMMDNPEYLSAVKKIMDPEFALFVNHYLKQDILELLIKRASELRSGMRAVRRAA